MITPPVVKIMASTVYRNERVLPVEGDIVVRLGDQVHPETPIARVVLPSPPVEVPVASMLGVRPKDLAPYLVKQVGDRVQPGDVVARRKATMLQGKKECVSPIEGVVEYISYDLGQITIRRHARPTVIWAEAEGRVTEIIPKQAVVIEAGAAVIQGALGVGEEVSGPLRLLVGHPNERISASRLDRSCRDQVLVAGGIEDDGVLVEAQSIGVKGLILGSLAVSSPKSLPTLGNAHPLAIVVTDGFGAPGIFPPAFDIFRANQGRKAWLRPLATGRPEVVILLSDEGLPQAPDPPSLSIGSLVRGVRQPFSGLSGRVVALPKLPKELESGVRASVAEVETADRKRIIVALANLELIG